MKLAYGRGGRAPHGIGVIDAVDLMTRNRIAAPA